jgi:hypothetical protein
MPTFSTCNCAINRKLFDDIHFEEGFQSAGEDELLSRKISSRFEILYNPKAIVRHCPRDSFKGVFKWFLRRGQARVEMFSHIQNKIKYILKIIFTSQIIRLLLLISLCLWMDLPTLIIVGSFLVIYYISVIWRLRWSWRFYPSIKTILLLPIVKAVMDIGLDIGVLKTLLSGVKVGK